MPRYDYQTSYFHKRSTARRVHLVALIGVALVLVLAIWVGIDLLREHFRKDTEVSQSSEVSIQSEVVTSFRSIYFEFQAEENWREISSENKLNRLVYRRFAGPLVTDELVIDVGTPPQKSLAETISTRVLGVRINSDGTLTPQGLVSGHCKEVYPESGTALPKEIEMAEVNFVCNPNSTQYDVLVGVVGGGTELIIPSPSGQTKSFFIEYKSLETTPYGNRLIGLLSTFKTR